MADKTTITLHPPKGQGPIEVHPDQVARMKEKGWTLVPAPKSGKKKTAPAAVHLAAGGNAAGG